jgi:hypothetical protein
VSKTAKSVTDDELCEHWRAIQGHLREYGQTTQACAMFDTVARAFGVVWWEVDDDGLELLHRAAYSDPKERPAPAWGGAVEPPYHVDAPHDAPQSFTEGPGESLSGESGPPPPVSVLRV